MAHINFYAEDFENIELSVVEKKGYVGVKIESLREDSPLAYQVLTLWGFTKERLVADLELILSVAKTAKTLSISTGFSGKRLLGE